MGDETPKKDLTSLIDLTINTESVPQEGLDSSFLTVETKQEIVTEFAPLEESLTEFDPSESHTAESFPSIETPQQTEPLPSTGEQFNITSAPESAPETSFDLPAPAEPLPEPPKVPFDLSAVKSFAETIQIVKPVSPANPAFSLLAKGTFDERKQTLITGIISGLELGIHPDELKIQLENGRLFIPRVSEYVTSVICQKIRDITDSIEVDLADNIYPSSDVETQNLVSN